MKKAQEKQLQKEANWKEFKQIIQDIEQNSMVQKLHLYKQHCTTSRYDHCQNVAYYSYVLCKKLGLDYKAAARGGMLHDLFLYNWKKEHRELELNGLHAFEHPKIALQNACSQFCLTNKEKDIIAKHMWPVTFALPRYRESYIITLVDKYCATKEATDYLNEKYHLKELYRFSYVLLSMLMIRF